MLEWFYNRGANIFKTSRRDLKIVGARWVKQVPYWGPTNIKCHHIQFSCTGNMTPRIWALGGLRVCRNKCVTMAKLLRYFASLSWQPSLMYMVVTVIQQVTITSNVNSMPSLQVSCHGYTKIYHKCCCYTTNSPMKCKYVCDLKQFYITL